MPTTEEVGRRSRPGFGQRAPDSSQHAIAATGLDLAQAAAEFTEHAADEMQHGRIVITSYQEIIRWLGDNDPTTRRPADDLNDLLGN